MGAKARERRFLASTLRFAQFAAVTTAYVWLPLWQDAYHFKDSHIREESWSDVKVSFAMKDNTSLHLQGALVSSAQTCVDTGKTPLKYVSRKMMKIFGRDLASWPYGLTAKSERERACTCVSIAQIETLLMTHW